LGFGNLIIALNRASKEAKTCRSDEYLKYFNSSDLKLAPAMIKHEKLVRLEGRLHTFESDITKSTCAVV